MSDHDIKRDFAALVDVQSYWTKKNPATTLKILDNIDALREKYRILWIYAQEAGTGSEPSKPFHPVQSGDMQLKDISSLFNATSQLMDVPVIRPAPEDWIIGKETTDGFSNPLLEKFLKDQNSTQLYVAGFMTSYCVYDTALSGVKAGLPVTLLPDLSADESDGNEFSLDRFTAAGIKTFRTPGF